MSTTARLSLIGMYNFDPTIFDNLTLPEKIDKDVFVNVLLLSQGEKCALYPDVDFMRLSIQLWGRKWFDNLERIADALTEEYNPLHNYDRHEEYTDTETYGSKRSTETHEGRQSETHEGRQSESHTGHKGTLSNSPSYSTEETVSAMNTSNYEPDKKTTVSGKDIDQSSSDTFNGSGTDTLNSHGTDTMNGSGVDNETRNTKLIHSAHLYGNIGVTTSVAMLLEELNARAYNNIYDIACEIFARELLLYIY